MSKTKRLLKIRNIIQNNKISSQNELLEILNKIGYQSTQATLSRDLKYLRVNKVQDEEKGMIYVIPAQQTQDDSGIQVKDPSTFQNSGFISIDYTGNMAVIKTLPGFANSFAYKLDNMNAFEIIGTIAGDDTILVIGREGISRSELKKCLEPAILAKKNP